MHQRPCDWRDHSECQGQQGRKEAVVCGGARQERERLCSYLRGLRGCWGAFHRKRTRLNLKSPLAPSHRSWGGEGLTVRVAQCSRSDPRSWRCLSRGSTASVELCRAFEASHSRQPFKLLSWAYSHILVLKFCAGQMPVAHAYNTRLRLGEWWFQASETPSRWKRAGCGGSCLPAQERQEA